MDRILKQSFLLSYKLVNPLISSQPCRCLTNRYVNQKARQSARKSQRLLDAKLSSKKPSMPKPPKNTKGGFSSYFYSMPDNSALFDLKNVNKAFSKKIDELILCSPTFQNLLGNGIEITKVQVSPNLSKLYVFWTSSRSQNLDQVKDKLVTSADAMRSSLEQERLLSHCPPLEFICDNKKNYAEEVEEALTIADFGSIDEDKTDLSTESSDTEYTPFPELSNLQSNHKAKIISTDNISSDANTDITTASVHTGTTYSHGLTNSTSERKLNEESKKKLPPLDRSKTCKLQLKTDVYGVDHEAICAQILRKKSRQKDSSEDILQLHFDTSVKQFSKSFKKPVITDRDMKEVYKKERKQKHKWLNSQLVDLDLNVDHK